MKSVVTMRAAICNRTMGNSILYQLNQSQYDICLKGLC